MRRSENATPAVVPLTRMDCEGVPQGWSDLTGEPVAIRLDLLKSDIDLRCQGADGKHVEVLLEIGDDLPPIVVHAGTMTVIDGVHRVLAARRRGDECIAALLMPGSPADALVLAVRLNTGHGLPLSREDRHRAVKRLLLAQPGWSDRRLAQLAGVSARTVADIRRRSTADLPQSNIRTGRDGRIRPLTALDGRLRAASLFTEDPAATVRQVAAATGLSLATAHDVRRRLHEGMDPVPVRMRESDEPVVVQAPAVQPVPVPVGVARVGAARPCGESSSQPAPRGSAISSLSADPSMRSTIAGRALLRLLSMQVFSSGTLEELAPAVPAHRRDVVAGLARTCGEAWLRLATAIEGLSCAGH